MIKRILTIALAAFFAVSAAYSQSAQELIQKHLKAQGLDKMNGHQTMTIIGSATSPEQPTPIEFKTLYKLPSKARMELKVQEADVVIASNGSTHWVVNPLSGTSEPQDIPEEGLAQTKQILNLLKGPLYDAIKDTSTTLETLPNEEIEGSAYNVIKLVDGEQNNVKIYLNATSGWLYKVNQKVEQNGESHVIDTYMKNYTKVSGMAFPQLVETYIDGTIETKLTFSKIAVDEPMLDSLFDKPVTK